VSNQNWQRLSSPLNPLSPRSPLAASDNHKAAVLSPRDKRDMRSTRSVGVSTAMSRRVAFCGPHTVWRMAQKYADNMNVDMIDQPEDGPAPVEIESLIPTAGTRAPNRGTDLMPAIKPRGA